MTTFDNPTYRAFFASCCESFADELGWAALRDWLRDAGAGEEIAQEAAPLGAFRTYDVDRFVGRGRGSGSGSGIGRGSGSGSGIGSGIGSGRGSGSGSGRGRGGGSGGGSGSETQEVRQMEPGKCYLIHCGDWHTFVGRVVKQVGPMTYLIESVSKIRETNNGDCWHALAAGDKKLRRAASYEHYTTAAVIPLTVAAFEWSGALPQEM